LSSSNIGRTNAYFNQGKTTMTDFELMTWLERIESMLTALLEKETFKEYYSTEEFAKRVGKAEFTVRNWCRMGRIRANKKSSGRGAYPSWCISNEELLRYQRYGLLPLQLGHRMEDVRTNH
jgi:hypothetical protein